MEFGKYLAKGTWGLADKALPVVYGIGYVWLVIRVLPEEEFGNFVLVQEIFLVISGLATAFALQPLLKFSSEENARLEGIVSASLALNVLFVAVASLVVVACSAQAGPALEFPRALGAASLCARNACGFVFPQFHAGAPAIPVQGAAGVLDGRGTFCRAHRFSSG